jgi:hypothetical protein
MGKKSFAVVFSIVGVVACGGSGGQPVNPYVDDGTVARASIESEGCGARATLIALPEHCRWPESARRSPVLATSASVVVDVDADGKPRSARVVDATPNANANANANEGELRGAVVTCAMHGRYRAAWNGAGETCPVTIRLARYPTDLVAFP